MSDIIKDPTLISALQELAKGVKSERDLAALTQDLLKITVEASLNAEMDDHLGYPKHSPAGYGSGNSRNGYGTKKLKSGHGVIEIETPRDRNGSFEPQFVAKNQTRLSHFDDKILALYARGMKVIYLAIDNASKKWSMPLRDWKPAMNQFMIMFPDRIPY